MAPLSPAKAPFCHEKNTFFAQDGALLSRYGDLPRVKALFWHKKRLFANCGAILSIYGAHPTSEGALLSQDVPFLHMTVSF